MIELAKVAAAAVFIPLVIYLASQSDSSSNVGITTDGPIEEMIAWHEGVVRRNDSLFLTKITFSICQLRLFS